MPNVFWLRNAPPPSSELQVGEWFFIDRKLISERLSEIRLKCFLEGFKGIKLWRRLKNSYELAEEYNYPTFLETYIFPHNGEDLTEQGMRQMCKDKGYGICDEIICDLELMMLICVGVSVRDLDKRIDWLPYPRAIELRNGGTGYSGGGADRPLPHSNIFKGGYYPKDQLINATPYAWRPI